MYLLKKNYERANVHNKVEWKKRSLHSCITFLHTLHLTLCANKCKVTSKPTPKYISSKSLNIFFNNLTLHKTNPYVNKWVSFQLTNTIDLFGKFQRLNIFLSLIHYNWQTDKRAYIYLKLFSKRFTQKFFMRI